MDINPSDTLQYRAGRDNNDERHIAPLQLGVIRRCIDLWSNPRDIVFTPFAGIGSEVHTAVCAGRYGMGVELKPSYFKQAIRNMETAEADAKDLLSRVS
jgi:DNA modification methylase